MSKCPKCFTEKPFLSEKCPNCTHSVSAGEEIGFNVLSFIISVVFFLFLLGLLFG